MPFHEKVGKNSEKVRIHFLKKEGLSNVKGRESRFFFANQ